MQNKSFTQLAYGFEKELPGVSYEEALVKVTAALQGKGFGVSDRD